MQALKSRLTHLVSVVAMIAVAGLAPSVVVSQELPEAPLKKYGDSRAIPDRYIVVFKDQVKNPKAEAENMMRGRGGEIHFIYTNAIKGFAATLPPQALDALLRNPNVEYIEQDATVSINATQNNVTWGLDRIDETTLLLDGSYSYAATGKGVYAFVVDTGIRSSHNDFGTRVNRALRFDAFGGTSEDCNGHGTHVAGTVGGATWGVAKEVTLVPVRVLDCGGSGSWSGVIAGLDHIAALTTARPAVANMSLGGGASTSVDAAVRRASDVGVTVVVAAGNSNADACRYSPAREPLALTVGSTTSLDSRASYSNYGKCLDVFAPGSSITSAWYNSNSATNTISGTSMASPHVAGVVALYLQRVPSADSKKVASVVLGNASTGMVTSAGNGSPNRLLYSLIDTNVELANQPPVANFSVTCSELKCTFNSTSADTDGTIRHYAWSLGDGSSESASSFSKTYSTYGDYPVTLTVTDDDGATGSITKVVSLKAPTGGGRKSSK